MEEPHEVYEAYTRRVEERHERKIRTTACRECAHCSVDDTKAVCVIAYEDKMGKWVPETIWIDPDTLLIDSECGGDSFE
jgi:hypothetical protein